MLHTKIPVLEELWESFKLYVQLLSNLIYIHIIESHSTAVRDKIDFPTYYLPFFIARVIAVHVLTYYLSNPHKHILEIRS